MPASLPGQRSRGRSCDGIGTCLRVLAGALPLLMAAAADSAETCDLVISGGRIVDGTGAPWFVADVAIDDGRIVKIGRIDGWFEGARTIDARGLVVAPGFIDLMGQTATPMLDDPATGRNLLAQGITTINAGEGVSAAPLAGDDARTRGWATLAEYFQLLDLRGLPVNVVQTVGHTQVRRLVIGDDDRRPTEEELDRMKALVREGMEAGAIGLSTALIYPPAVYADAAEIAALASVAGEFGGRYYTHLRNEGDRLLEAIDEALEIGRLAGTPVHIFHLKAAGRRNWAVMDEAVARIEAARADGRQVAADIYPYVNNGLGIAAMIHPRRFARGHAAFLETLDDPDVRAAIRAELESDEGDWENWFKHIGGDWNRLVVGRANSLRFKSHDGKTLAAIADAIEADPWEVFFDLVRTDAFVLPESMSEENKRRLLREPFISFCTDVGPAGGAAGSSHPRGFGSFPRILGRYVREQGVIPLERAVAQASAVAANEVLAFDRGRIAEGLAADVIVFDAGTIVDRATFADPHALSEGVRFVVVNGEVVLDEGELAEARPGRVLRGPGFRPEFASDRVSTGEEVPALQGVDQVMRDFIRRHRVPGAAVAVTDAGRLVYARGFGFADVAAREAVSPESLFRIASISKPVTAAAIFRLVEAGRLRLDDRVFDILSGYRPVSEDVEIDPRLAEITVLELLQHRGGWDRDRSFDPMFRSVPFAESLGMAPPADQDAIIRNMLGQPLDFDPGTRQAYSNFGFCLLGRIVNRVTGTDYQAWVKDHVLDPVGARTMVLGRSLPEFRREGEVRYYSPHRGPSVFAETLGRTVPYPHGGWFLEAMDSHGAWLASVVDLARFAVAFDAPPGGDGAPSGGFLEEATRATMFARPEGLGKDPGARCLAAGWGRTESERGIVFSHSGSLAGTSTLLVKRPDGRNWVVLFNARGAPRAEFLPSALRPFLDAALDEVREWPEGDQFAAFARHQPRPAPPSSEPEPPTASPPPGDGERPDDSP